MKKGRARAGKIAGFMAVLGGAALLLAPAAAQAQTGPIYFTPKIMYSHQMSDGFDATGKFSGFELNSGKYSGSDKTDNTFGGGLAIGYDFGEVGDFPVRTELEYLIRSRSEAKYPTKRTSSSASGISFIDSDYRTEATVQTVFANVYFDFRNDSAFTPYIGAGLGGANVKGELKSKHTGQMYNTNNGRGYTLDNDFDGSHESWNFAWNLSAGASYRFTDSVALDLSYRYSDFGEVEYGTHGFQLYDMADGSHIGGYGGKAKSDLTAHEVILGVRISAF
ncbi:hypothetical protein C4J81_00470 [Deltaproteobacteria bacterium Smac51]|nr:hypothetical protein C4J81_00470 [Deltaproteobacteria bacterium Smac51]